MDTPGLFRAISVFADRRHHLLVASPATLFKNSEASDGFCRLVSRCPYVRQSRRAGSIRGTIWLLAQSSAGRLTLCSVPMALNAVTSWRDAGTLRKVRRTFGRPTRVKDGQTRYSLLCLAVRRPLATVSTRLPSIRSAVGRGLPGTAVGPRQRLKEVQASFHGIECLFRPHAGQNQGNCNASTPDSRPSSNRRLLFVLRHRFYLYVAGVDVASACLARRTLRCRSHVLQLINDRRGASSCRCSLPIFRVQAQPKRPSIAHPDTHGRLPARGECVRPQGG